MKPFRFLIFTSADEFFLSRARETLEGEFARSFPEGEVTILDPPPSLSLFQEELQTPSLFSSSRLILVPKGELLLAADEGQANRFRRPQLGDGETLWVAIFACQEQPPRGPFIQVVAPWAELSHVSLPPPPKPWEEVRLSREQRELLVGILLEEVPSLRGYQDVVDALLETHGFSPRLLVQAARGLVAAQQLTPEAAKSSIGQKTVPAAALERAIQGANWQALGEVLGSLAAGAALEGFRGELSFGRRAAQGVAALLARTCVSALVLRLLAERTGLAAELSPLQTAQPGWYPKAFKPRILPALLKAAETMPELRLAERSPWALQGSFRVAAQFSSERLLAALGGLLRFDALRGSFEEPWAPVTFAYASLFASSRSW